MSATPRSKQLNFRGLFSIILIIVVFIFVMTLALGLLNKRRAEQVHKTYSEESNTYIKKNRDGLTQIFTHMRESTCFEGNCNSMKQDEIMSIISHDLIDFSSTAFVAVNIDGELMLQRLSGERELLYSSDLTSTKMRELISGTVTKLPWDEYLYYYEGKEVVVPVKNVKGEVIGLLVRSAVAK